MHPTPGLYAERKTHKVYEGKITLSDREVVTINGQPLPWALEVESHSTTGLNWGYGGAGPTQLTVALLADAFGPEFARDFSWMLMDLVKTTMKRGKPWVLTEQDLYGEFLRIRAEKPDEHTRAAFAAIEKFFKSGR